MKVSLFATLRSLVLYCAAAGLLAGVAVVVTERLESRGGPKRVIAQERPRERLRGAASPDLTVKGTSETPKTAVLGPANDARPRGASAGSLPVALALTAVAGENGAAETETVVQSRDTAASPGPLVPQPSLPAAAPADALPVEADSFAANDAAQPAGKRGPRRMADAGADAPAADTARVLERRGDLMLKKVSLAKALFVVKEDWNLNLVVGADVPDVQIDAAFVQTPLREILDSLLLPNGCGYRFAGQTMIVSRLENLGGDNAVFETVMVPLTAAQPQDASTVAKSKLSRFGKVEVMPTAKAVLVTDLRTQVDRVRDAIQAFDKAMADRDAAALAANPPVEPAPAPEPVKPELATFSPRHIPVAQLIKPIQGLLSREGKIEPDAATNQLTVVDTPANLALVRQLVEHRDIADNALQLKTFTLRSAKVESLEPQIRELLSDDGKVTVSEAENRIVVQDYPRVIQRIEQFVGESDNTRAEMQTLELRPQYIKASKELVNVVKGMVSTQGKVDLLESEGRLVVTDYPYHLRRVQEHFQKIDVMRRQTRITALIYDIENTDLWRLGVDWRGAGKINGRNTIQVDSIVKPPYLVSPGVFPNATAAATGAATGAASGAARGLNLPEGLTFMYASPDFDLGATLKALSETTNSRLLADPSITVLDRNQGQIKIVEEIPFQQLTQGGGSNSPIGTTAFKEAGVTLDVMPRIADDNNIELTISPTFSRLTGYDQNGQPIIDTRSAKTVLWAHDGDTIVMGGLRAREKIVVNRGIPYLKDVQFMHLNKLFSYEQRDFRESELVVFILPHIVGPTYHGREREEVIGPHSFECLDRISFPAACPGDCEPLTGYPSGNPTLGNHHRQGYGGEYPAGEYPNGEFPVDKNMPYPESQLPTPPPVKTSQNATMPSGGATPQKRNTHASATASNASRQTPASPSATAQSARGANSMKPATMAKSTVSTPSGRSSNQVRASNASSAVAGSSTYDAINPDTLPAIAVPSPTIIPTEVRPVDYGRVIGTGSPTRP